eukprot:352597-Chlamydomonas_euryale.AAC.9
MRSAITTDDGVTSGTSALSVADTPCAPTGADAGARACSRDAGSIFRTATCRVPLLPDPAALAALAARAALCAALKLLPAAQPKRRRDKQRERPGVRVGAANARQRLIAAQEALHLDVDTPLRKERVDAVPHQLAAGAAGGHWDQSVARHAAIPAGRRCPATAAPALHVAPAAIPAPALRLGKRIERAARRMARAHARVAASACRAARQQVHTDAGDTEPRHRACAPLLPPLDARHAPQACAPCEAGCGESVLPHRTRQLPQRAQRRGLALCANTDNAAAVAAVGVGLRGVRRRSGCGCRVCWRRRVRRVREAARGHPAGHRPDGNHQAVSPAARVNAAKTAGPPMQLSAATAGSTTGVRTARPLAPRARLPLL